MEERIIEIYMIAMWIKLDNKFKITKNSAWHPVSAQKMLANFFFYFFFGSNEVQRKYPGFKAWRESRIHIRENLGCQTSRVNT